MKPVTLILCSQASPCTAENPCIPWTRAASQGATCMPQHPELQNTPGWYTLPVEGTNTIPEAPFYVFYNDNDNDNDRRLGLTAVADQPDYN